MCVWGEFTSHVDFISHICFFLLYHSRQILLEGEDYFLHNANNSMVTILQKAIQVITSCISSAEVSIRQASWANRVFRISFCRLVLRLLIPHRRIGKLVFRGVSFLRFDEKSRFPIRHAIPCPNGERSSPYGSPSRTASPV